MKKMMLLYFLIISIFSLQATEETSFVTMEMKKASVEDVLHCIAKSSGMNIVIPDLNCRPVTLSLVNVPADEALKAVCVACGISIRTIGSVRVVSDAVRVVKEKEIKKEIQCPAGMQYLPPPPPVFPGMKKEWFQKNEHERQQESIKRPERRSWKEDRKKTRKNNDCSCGEDDCDECRCSDDCMKNEECEGCSESDENCEEQIDLDEDRVLHPSAHFMKVYPLHNEVQLSFGKEKVLLREGDEMDIRIRLEKVVNPRKVLISYPDFHFLEEVDIDDIL